MEVEAPKKPPTPIPPWWERDMDKLIDIILSKLGALLTRSQLCVCIMPVCKRWHDAVLAMDDVWETIDLNGKQDLTSEQWASVAKRSPKHVNIG